MVLIFLLTWLPGSEFGLWESSDARYAEISRAMVRTGDWLEPRSNGILHFHKPPLAYWCAGASMLIFGTSEGAARLPLALSVVAVAWIIRRRRDLAGSTSRGAVAALLWGSSFLTLGVAHTLTADLFLTLAATVAFLSGLDALRQRGRLFADAFWVAAAAGFMTKGPVGFLVPFLPLLVESLMSDRGRSLKRLFPVEGPLLFLVLGLPWYVIVVMRHPDLVDYFLVNQTWQRYTTEIHGRGGPFWIFVPVLIFGFLPWTVILFRSLGHYLQRPQADERPLWLGVAVPLLLFSFSGSKLPAYLLPTFPLLALACARHAPVWGPRTSKAQAGLLMLAGLAAGAFALKSGHPALREGGRWLPAIFCVAAGLASGIVTILVRKNQSIAILAGGIVFVAVVLAGACVCVPHVQEWLGSTRPLARLLEKAKEPGTEIVSYKKDLRGLAFYLDHPVRTIGVSREMQFEEGSERGGPLALPQNTDVDSLADSFSRILWISTEKDLPQLTFHLRRPLRPVGEVGPWRVMETDGPPL
jgi:4-amino-4-deoxy-L-arabinose transferase-like glycosyltransferase